MRSFSLNRSHQRLPIAVEAERAEANSSPDLGIESDQGRYDRLLFIVYTNVPKNRFLFNRFSSLETNGNNVHRPLLPTIELTESLSNLFDGQQDDFNVANGNNY